MHSNIKKSVLLIALLITLQSIAQDFMMQGFYWDYPKTCVGNSWSQNLRLKAIELSNAGITDIWLPPLSRGQGGCNSNGYDVYDYYDLGEFGFGPTGFGTRNQVNVLINELNTVGINAIADVVYNHRSGGIAEPNPAVKDYITQHYFYPKTPFPTDRYFCRLPIGGSSGNDAGDYYFKISSKSQNPAFHNFQYAVQMSTGQVGWQNQADQMEVEPNGGGDCAQPFNQIELGVNTIASIDASGCTLDEFYLKLDSNDYNLAGDYIYFSLNNYFSGNSDHRVYQLWSANAGADIVDQIEYMTYTNFTNVPSGQGQMNFENFKPNSQNANSTYLQGDWDELIFFYDVDQYSSNTQSVLYDYTNWLHSDVGINGLRMDAVKHFDPAFVGDLLDGMYDLGHVPNIVVGEFFDFNPQLLVNWVNSTKAAMDNDTKAAINPRVFDFALRGALQQACDAFGYDVRNVFESGMVDGAGGNGSDAITFINNHDFREPGQPVQNDPLLAYVYIMTNNQIGVPCIFYSDYFGDQVPHYPTLDIKDELNELMDIHSEYIFGAASRTYLSEFGTPFSSNYTSGSANTSLIYQLSNSGNGNEVIVAINFAGDNLNVSHNINTDNFQEGTIFNDLTGNSASPNQVVSSNSIFIDVPPRSYAIYVKDNSCALDLVLDQNTNPSNTFVADNSINSTSIISQQTTYKAGSYIQLNDGFEVLQSIDFEILIEGCLP